MLVPVVPPCCSTGVLSALFLSASGKVKDKQAELATLQDELRAIPTPDACQAFKTQTRARGRQAGARGRALEQALSRRVAWDRVFRELSLVLPDDVWLATHLGEGPVSRRRVPDAGGSTGTTVAATGVHDRRLHVLAAAVARLLSRLAVVPDLVNVQLQQSTLTKIGAPRPSTSRSSPTCGPGRHAREAPRSRSRS